jgi:hypothetical protein
LLRAAKFASFHRCSDLVAYLRTLSDGAQHPGDANEEKLFNSTVGACSIPRLTIGEIATPAAATPPLAAFPATTLRIVLPALHNTFSKKGQGPG